MAKWFSEELLIKYWEDRCQLYKFKDGRGIISAERNPSFGRYPDIGKNIVSDKSCVPAEIEWYTTSFDRHKHDIKVLADQNGFLVVLKNNASFPLEQIEIDREDFIQWFKSSAESLAIETLHDIEREVVRSREPQVFLYYVPQKGKDNLDLAIKTGTWGFPDNGAKALRGLPVISSIKPHDIVIVVHGFEADKTLGVSGGRLPAAHFIGQFRELQGLVVTSKFYKSATPVWSDQVYPNRFDFRKPQLFSGKDIPCTEKTLGRSLHELLRRLVVNGSMQKIDGSMMTRLMSLCTK